MTNPDLKTKQQERSKEYQKRIRENSEIRKTLNERVKQTKAKYKELYKAKNIEYLRKFRQKQKQMKDLQL
jgi:hypothetical protein